MTKSEFIDELKEAIEVDDLTEDQKLADLEEFDSLAVMGIVAMVFTHFNKKLSGTDIQKAATVKDLMELVGTENFK